MEDVEGVRELEPAATDVRMVRLPKTYFRFFGNLRAGLGYRPTIHEHDARQDEGLRTFSRHGEAALNEQHVETDLQRTRVLARGDVISGFARGHPGSNVAETARLNAGRSQHVERMFPLLGRQTLRGLEAVQGRVG